jgi:hypothetical protein
MELQMMLDYDSDGVVTLQELMKAIKESYDARGCMRLTCGANYRDGVRHRVKGILVHCRKQPAWPLLALG